MPLTWFAHQVPVIGMKLGRPRWLDATALCLGSMTPDVMYAVSGYVGFDTHRSPITFVAGVPLVVVLAWVVRCVLAPVGPAQLPDLGAFRIHSWAVLSRRRPHVAVSSMSAFLGIGSHIVLDWFTHPGRRGVRWLGYDDATVTVLGVTEPLAGVLQLVGHSFGSLAAVSMLWLIGRRRLLDEWYGADAVESARRWQPASRDRLVFWCGLACGSCGGAVWGLTGSRIELIERTFVGTLLGAVVSAAAVRRGRGERWRPSTRLQERATATPVE